MNRKVKMNKEVEMRKRHILAGSLLVLATVGLLAGCGGAAATETVSTDEVPVVISDASGKVVAEAVIEPDRWSELHFDVGGNVAEVPAQEGDAVAEGDLLARLEATDLERAVAQADLNLNQARVRLGQAQLKLEQLQEPADEADIRQAEHAVDQAAAAIKAAQLDLTAVLDSTLLNETLEDAEEVYEDMQHKYEARLEMYKSGEEPDYWLVDQAQERLDDAKLDLDRIHQQGNAQLQDARNAVQQAQQSYQEAQDALAELLEGADPLDVEAAQSDVEAAQLDVEAAELSLAEAQSNLEDAEIVAPFTGVVVERNVDPGDAVTSGEVALVLATLDRLQVRTVDLTELEIARVAEGQAAVVTVDALPDVQLRGHVVRIGLQSVDYRGDVTYPVTVELDEAASELRWGMTAMVEIEAD
jgi:multidrug resistance efflux pump